jgi:hypothetical protein
MDLDENRGFGKGGDRDHEVPDVLVESKFLKTDLDFL